MTRRPRIGLLGVGWIGRNRMEAVLAAGEADIVAIVDPSPEMAAAAHERAPGAALVPSLDALLAHGVDGVMIATPSALHAAQSVQALRHGAAVFCQKPLGRTEAEARDAIAAAADANRLLAVDLSYRFTNAMTRVREIVAGGEIGEVYAAELVFHNAYGPDKPWFYDRARSGGGCVMDLGVHLIDLCLWVLDFPAVSDVAARLFAQGRPWRGAEHGVEDYADIRLDLATGVAVRLACSWNLSLGRDAAIAAYFYGTGGGVAFRNVGGSFYDFTAELYRGTTCHALASPPDAWGGRAAAAWASGLAQGCGFDPDIRRIADVARVLDLIYRCAA